MGGEIILAVLGGCLEFLHIAFGASSSITVPTTCLGPCSLPPAVVTMRKGVETSETSLVALNHPPAQIAEVFSERCLPQGEEGKALATSPVWQPWGPSQRLPLFHFTPCSIGSNGNLQEVKN